ncbi:MAG: hypothetical protein PUF61_05855 [Spirochaetales bacterium]|nr:hypothetical protein [Spirochaetales bacterium]
MEEELIENKEPSKFGKAALWLFIISIVAFFAAVECGGVYGEALWIRIRYWISQAFFGISFFSALAIFPVSIIGIIKDRKTKQTKACSVILIVQTILLALAVGFVFLVGSGFESTSDQMKKLRKMPEIEEFIITHDRDDFMHDGLMNNDYELYLTDGRFLKVNNLTESMDYEKFHVEAIGQYSVEVQRDQRNYGEFLSLSDLSFLAGKKIKKFQDVLDNYSAILTRLEDAPFVDEDGEQLEIKLAPVDKSALAVRESEFFADLQTMPHIVSVQKMDFVTSYLQYYKYAVKMDDGVQFDMTLSTVLRDGGGYSCNFFITSYNGKEVKHVYLTEATRGTKYYKPYECWRFAHDTGLEVKSYRDLFNNYEAFKKSIETFIAENAE